MAKLGCTCVNSLSNSTDFNTNIIFVFYKDEIINEIKKNSQILFDNFYEHIDFYSEQDYWYCPCCKRVIECSMKTNLVLRKFKPSNIIQKESNTDNWKEFYVFSDNELLRMTEDNFKQNYKMTLLEFYEKYPRKYFYKISPDETKVFAYNNKTRLLAFAYELEKLEYSNG